MLSERSGVIDLGLEGKMLLAAFAAGAIPAEADADEFVSAPKATFEKTDHELIQNAIKTMLERNDEGDFTAGGLPNRKKLSALVGMNVSAEDLTIAWTALNEAL